MLKNLEKSFRVEEAEVVERARERKNLERSLGLMQGIQGE